MADLIPLEPEPLGEGLMPLLEHLMEAAKAGEISSLGVGIVYRDGRIGAKWSFAPSRAALLGAVGRLEHKLNLEADEEG